MSDYLEILDRSAAHGCKGASNFPTARARQRRFLARALLIERARTRRLRAELESHREAGREVIAEMALERPCQHDWQDCTGAPSRCPLCLADDVEDLAGANVHLAERSLPSDLDEIERLREEVASLSEGMAYLEQEMTIEGLEAENERMRAELSQARSQAEVTRDLLIESEQSHEDTSGRFCEYWFTWEAE